jgi:hypothetical protein
MPNIDEILNSTTTETGNAYYDPSLDFDGIIPVGDYYAHITGLEVKKNIIIRNKFLADIYVPAFRLAKENSDKDFGSNGEMISGKAFVGRELKGKGFFRFKNPDKAKYPNLSDSQGSNKRYMEFIESLGIKTSDGGSGIFRLPEISEDDIYGKPVLAKVIHDKWTTDDGEERSTAKVLSLFSWKDGKREMLDVPF